MKPSFLSLGLLLPLLFSCSKQHDFHPEPISSEKTLWQNEIQQMKTALSNASQALSPLNNLTGKELQDIEVGNNILYQLSQLGVDINVLTQESANFKAAFQAARNLGAGNENIISALAQNSGQPAGTPCFDAFEASIILAYGDMLGCMIDGGSTGCLISCLIAVSVANGVYHRCMETTYGAGGG